jgi:hypothetical protein
MVYPQNSLASVEARLLEGKEFSETDRPVMEDHAAHVAGKTCVKCDRPIKSGQDARRWGESDWVHDVCPPQTDRTEVPD